MSLQESSFWVVQHNNGSFRAGYKQRTRAPKLYVSNGIAKSYAKRPGDKVLHVKLVEVEE